MQKLIAVLLAISLVPVQPLTAFAGMVLSGKAPAVGARIAPVPGGLGRVGAAAGNAGPRLARPGLGGTLVLPSRPSPAPALTLSGGSSVSAPVKAMAADAASMGDFSAASFSGESVSLKSAPGSAQWERFLKAFSARETQRGSGSREPNAAKRLLGTFKSAQAAFRPLLAPASSRGGEAASLLRRVMDGGYGRRFEEVPAAGGDTVRGSVSRFFQTRRAAASLHAPETAIAIGEGRDLHGIDIPVHPVSEAVGRSYKSRRINSAYIFWRALLAPFFQYFYRPSVRGLQHLPRRGAALLLPNHVTWIDVFLLSFVAGRPIRFLMHKEYYENPWMHWFVKSFEPIPIEPGNKESVNRAMAEARQALKDGDLVAIFPEGTLTRTGSMQRFKRGLESIAKGLEAPALPVYLDGLWGSLFSRAAGTSPLRSLLHMGRSVRIHFGPKLPEPTVDTARDAVEQLAAQSMADRVRGHHETLPLAFLRAAKRFWSREAVVDSTGKKLKFGETLTATVLLGSELAPALAGEETVGIFLPPTAAGVLANTALASLGKVPVNLNYTAGQAALRHSVDKAGIKTVVTSRKFLEVLKEKKGREFELGAKYVYLEDILPKISKPRKVFTHILLRLLPLWLIRALFFRGAARDMEKLAAVIFTSGSTSLPKGVELTQMNVRSNIAMLEEVFPFGPGETMLGVLPFFHSFGFTVTLWLPLLKGMKTVFHTDPFDAKTIGKLAAEHEATILLGTPTFLRRYAERVPREAFTHMRLVVAGAEKLWPRDAENFQKAFGIAPLEGYGTTETSPVAATNLPDSIVERDGKRVVELVGNKPGSVGRPLPGVVLRIVDPETGLIRPAGKEGLILIKGPNVMRGYLGEPEKTAEAIRGGWYVTGDIGYRDRDGFLYITGRQSRFSKIAGEMVSHELVEAKLHEAAGVVDRAFAVAGVPDESRGERLVVLYTEFGGTVEGLLGKLDADLPNIARPKAGDFYPVKELPVLGSGKLDLQAVQELAKKLAGGGVSR